jgi:anti-sigma B factor antagonist
MPMTEQLSFEASILDDDILLVILIGSLDSVTTAEFNSRINQHLDQGMSKVIIDCRRLGYISSIGIGSLMSLQTRLARKGGKVKLAALDGMVADVIRIVKLDRLLDIYGDTEFARQSFYA